MKWTLTERQFKDNCGFDEKIIVMAAILVYISAKKLERPFRT